MVAKRKPRKGFTRSQKEWEETIAKHIGKVIDNLRGEDIINLTCAGICAFAGYRGAKELGADEAVAVGAAGSGVIAYQLAKSMNMIAGAAGAGYLASLGLINLYGADLVRKGQILVEGQRLWGGWLPIWAKKGSALQEWLFPEA